MVYLLDYDYSGLSPRITDRAWIDGAASGISAAGIPFVVVLPIYNRALLYSANSQIPTVLPAIDLAAVNVGEQYTSDGLGGYRICAEIRP